MSTVEQAASRARCRRLEAVEGARLLGADLAFGSAATRLAIAGGIFIIVMFLVAFVGAPIASHLLGHGPNDQFCDAVDPRLVPSRRPDVATFKTLTARHDLFILGADSTIGRDLFLRLLYGAQTSLEVAVFATFFAVSSACCGRAGGLLPGWRRHVISRLDGDDHGVPALLFIIAISATAGDS